MQTFQALFTTLEMNLYVDSHLEGHATLGGIDGLACGCAAESEGGVLGVGDVAGPEVDIHTALLGLAHDGLEVLLHVGVDVVAKEPALAIHIYMDFLQRRMANQK